MDEIRKILTGNGLLLLAGFAILSGCETQKVANDAESAALTALPTPSATPRFGTPTPSATPVVRIQPTSTLIDSAADDNPYAIAMDSQGNVIVGGLTNGVLGASQFDYRDAFVRKIRTDGSVAWTRQFGSSDNNDGVYALITDSSGNIYAAGSGGALNGPSNGAEDNFIHKLDADGNTVWLRTDGGAGYERINVLMPDGAGGLYSFGSRAPDWGNQGAGSGDCLLSRYDSSGSLLWSRVFGTSGDAGFYDESYFCQAASRVSSTGELYLAFSTRGSYAGQSSAGGMDFVVLKVDAAGNPVWTRQWGGTGDDFVFGIQADSSGHLYMTGKTSSAWPGTEGTPVASQLLVARVDPVGNLLWVTTTGGTGDDEGQAIQLGADGKLYVTGMSDGGGSLGASAGEQDVVMARLSVDGRVESTGVSGSTGLDIGRRLVIDPTGRSLFVAGWTKSPVFFGAPVSGGSGGFLLKFDLLSGNSF